MAALIDDEIPSYCPTRVDHINGTIAGYLQKIGVKEVFVGVESASMDTLAGIRKNISVNTIEKKCHILTDHSITPRLSFISGLPRETRESVILTLKYINHVIKLWRGKLNIVLFPYRQDIAATPADFEKYKHVKTVADALVPHHDQLFRMWIFSLVYLVNTYHNVLPLEEQIAAFDNLIKSSPKAVIELAKKYDGKQRSWLLGYQKYFQNGHKNYSWRV